ncbi:MAG TPA: HAMP domain-containing sensor histidine kinase [Euzebya sp.]|nr:HAMP domain-containing sensor histidine kinase [Euzebya sp.]
MTSRRSAAIAGLVGTALVAAVASVLGLPREDLVQLVVIAGGAALITGLLGAAALQLLRGRSFTAQVVVVALTSTSAVTAGALAGGNAMFFDAHDLQVLFVVVAVGAVVSVIAALLLGERVGAASRSLGEVARRLGDPDGRNSPAEDSPIVGGMPENLIAEFRRLADQLEQTRCELDASRDRERATDKARRELVSWVSHDLRTPLAGIRAITELLEDDIVEDQDEIRGYYTTLRRESDKLAALVQDLFEVSRIEAGALRIDYTEINLEDLVADTLAGAIPVAEQRGVRLYAKVADPAATILGGLPEVSRVLRNLVSNAIRESADGGAVLVEAGLATTPAGRCGFLAVQDTCGGIPTDVIDRVFEASYRGESARTPRSDGGGGLGLAIARGFVQAHGGTISVGNVADGCRFHVTLPVGPPPRGHSPQPVADTVAPPLRLGPSAVG